MKESNTIRLKTCPLCGRLYTDVPALSRVDNETLICPDCGTREALAGLGIADTEQEEIIQVIHRFRRGSDEHESE